MRGCVYQPVGACGGGARGRAAKESWHGDARPGPSLLPSSADDEARRPIDDGVELGLIDRRSRVHVLRTHLAALVRVRTREHGALAAKDLVALGLALVAR